MLGWTLGGSICSFSSDFFSPREPAPRPEILLSRFLVHWKEFSNYLFVCRKWPSTFPFRWRGGGEEIPKLTRAGDAGSGRPNFFCTTRRIDTWGHSSMKTTVTWCRGSKTLWGWAKCVVAVRAASRLVFYRVGRDEWCAMPCKLTSMW